MADKVPIRAAYNGSSALTGLATFASSETIGVAHGGTGATSLTDNGILVGNATGAIQVTSALTTNGQVVVGGTSGPAVANIAGTANEVDITNGDGTITVGLSSTISGLKINQCVQAYQASVTSTTSTSMTDISGLTKNITPSSVLSQILIMVDVYVSNSGSNTWWAQLVRDSTTIGGDTNDYIDGGGANASAYNRNRVSVIYIDSPATTQETTYKAQWKCDGNTLYLNRTGAVDTRGGTSSITLMEVLA